MKTVEPSETELAKMDPGVATFWTSGAPGPVAVMVRLGAPPTPETEAFFAHSGLSLTGPVGSGRVTRAGLASLLRRAEVIEVSDGSVMLTP